MNIDKVIEALKKGMKIKLKTSNGDKTFCLNLNYDIINENGKEEGILIAPTVIRSLKDMENLKEINMEIVYPEVLDKEEKEYLENWVRPFKKQNPTIAKRTHSLTTSCGDISRSEIEMSIDNITYGLPSFDTDTMYKKYGAEQEIHP